MSPRIARERPGRLLGRRILWRYGDGHAVFNIARWLLAFSLIAVLWLAVGDGEAQAATRILALGDSLTAGFGLSPQEAFPVRLQAKLATAGVDAQVVNGGVSGDTSAGGLARLDWALADHPDLVLVELGANDALRGIDPRLTYANLDKILTRIQAAGAKVLLLGMRAPPNWGRPYQAQFDAIFPDLAAKHHVSLYPFFLDGVALDPALNQSDGLHPTARGADIIAERVAPLVQRLLADKAAQG
ncbi:MAG TPA: arylesterase [Stellaceae bacterium]|nr:arylesterase [Stellaceae bacterium]